MCSLDEETLDCLLEALDLCLELASFVGGDRGRDDRARDATGTAESSLGRDKDIGNVLVLSEEGQVEQDLDGLGISSHDNELADSTIERLCGCVSGGRE